MGVQDWAQIGAALGIGSIAPWIWRKIRRDPKGDAEARQINADASRTEWAALKDEIDRLAATVTRQGRCIADLEAKAATRATREDELERENKLLRTQVGRLRRRVEGLEKILKVEVTITPEMQRLIDELPDDTNNEPTAEGGGDESD